MSQNRQGSGAGMGGLLVVIALAFIVLPFMFSNVVTGIAQIILVGFGVLLLLAGTIILIITRLYVKTAADEAFVKTGGRGRKVIIDGGMIVIPVIHKVVWVSLQTMRLDVPRMGKDALITGDKLRADIKAEFYIKVQKNEEDVISAATSLGEKSVNSETVKELVMEKLVSALRTVAATRSLYDLNEKRDEFADAVQKIVEKDLKHNGLTLESVTVSMLDQTPPTDMQSETNIFDAEGAKKIAEITQQQRVAKNQIERDADKKVKEQDVEKDQFVYHQEVTRATAEANQDSEISKAQSKAQQEADTFAAEQEETARVREVAKDQAIEVANVKKAQQVQVTNEQREQAQLEASVVKDKAVAVRRKEQADAEAEQKLAEAEREAASQKVLTVAVTETAKREAEKTYIDETRKVDQEAYKKERQAKADATAQINIAEGKLKAAENEAQATIKLADAAKEKAVKEAEGQRANQMVPVDVNARQVEVDANRVNTVLKPELEAKTAHQEISVRLELGLKQIEVDGRVREAWATAAGTALGGAKTNIFGTPATMTEMMELFNKGLGVNTAINGFMESASPEGMNLLGNVASGIKDTITGIFRGIFGKTLDEGTITAIAKKITDNPGILDDVKEKAAKALTGSKGEAALASFLVETFDGVDLGVATDLIAKIKKNPSILSQLSSALDVITNTSKQG